MPLVEHVFTAVSSARCVRSVAYKDGTFSRVQVKYRSARNGVVYVVFTSTWADGHGIHKRALDKSEVDVICIFCPETDACYYIDPSAHRGSRKVRLTPARNNQVAGVNVGTSLRLMPGRLVGASAEVAVASQPGLF